jgi:uncharacterized protein
MKLLSKTITIVLGVSLSHVASAILPINKTPTPVVLKGDEGGKVIGGPWDSSNMKGKIHVLFYSAPNQKDLNKEASAALKKESFDGDLFSSVAVVNMKASFWPNWLINRKLASSQKEFPRTTYVKDNNKKLVELWDLKDNSNDVVVFDKNGKVIFSVDGKLTEHQVSQMISLIKKHTQKLKQTIISKKANVLNKKS